jgi:hypothetical protein
VFPAAPLPAVVAEALDAVVAVQQCSHDTASADERAALLVGIRQIINVAEAAFTQVLSDFDAHGDGEVLHAAPSSSTWLRGALGMASGEATERVRIARVSRDVLAPAVAQLSSVPLPGGPTEMSYEQLRAIHRSTRLLPPSQRVDAAATLTELAPQLSVDQLRAAGRHLRDVIDPDGSARHAEEDFGRRWLSVAPLLGGMHSIDGVLDTETAAHLTTALAPFLVPSGPDDVRTADQRRADGLAEIVVTAVRSGELPTLSGASVALQVEVPLETLSGQSTHPARIGGDSTAPLLVTSDAASRMSCDASVRRLVIDPLGVPLNLGREVRVFTSAQRRALAARDRGCRFPGCFRPSRFTDAHHLVPWARGGVSDLANGLLLCRFHHRQVHEGGWRIEPVDSDAAAHGTLCFIGPADQRLVSTLPKRPGSAIDIEARGP